MAASVVYQQDHFKSDLADAYVKAGVKGEKLLFLLHDEELYHEDFLVYVQEYIISNSSVTNLFTFEEQTTIINSIRTEVTQAGLTYTRDVAWQFFLRSVSHNFRICIVESDGGSAFQRHCREYPALTQNVNFIWMAHWNKTELIDNALYLLKDVWWMSRVEKENMAHMLANMHLIIRQHDCHESNSGQYNHITNTTYEKFVERYVSLATSRYNDVSHTQTMAASALAQIRKENTMAERLYSQLEHEKVVLEEKKAGTVNMLGQIGQDTAITEQQVRIVRAQQEKIKKLKRLLPEYQVAHERAVYKASNIVADSKRNIKGMNPENLEKLRTMQKPIIDIEDLMAAVIIILKSPSSDLTWLKGAKRQLSNLDRFVEELLGFDDMHMADTTLQLVESYLKKQSFDPETLERKTGNSACKSLVQWVMGVAKYHRMMLSRVKPLHSKVEEMMKEVDLAEHKMASLDHKRTCLEARLSDLAQGFEEATVDKNEQEDKTVKMKSMLKTSARLRKIIKSEHKKYQQIYNSRGHRISCIAGSVAMASAFLSYLGPYHYSFRRVMLTIHWPRCLIERGIPLVFDSVDVQKGRIVDWSLDLPRTSPAAKVYDPETDFPDSVESSARYGVSSSQPSSHSNDDNAAEVPQSRDSPRNHDDKPEEKEDGEGTPRGADEAADHESQKLAEEDISEKEKEDVEEKERASPVPKDSDQDQEQSPVVGKGDKAEDADDDDAEEELVVEDEEEDEDEEADDATLPGGGDDDEVGTEYADTEASVPVLSVQEYSHYVKSLIKLIVGQDTMVEWTKADLGQRQLENAAMIMSSWQRPPFLIDPSGDGIHWLRWLNQSLGNRALTTLDMEMSLMPERAHVEAPLVWRADPQMLSTMEKCILRGQTAVLENCRDSMDNDIMPLVYHQNFMGEKLDTNAEPKMIRFCDRRILCHNKFHMYLSTRIPKPRFSTEIASTTQLVNYGVAHETLVEELLNRAFARLRPELFLEKRKALVAREALKSVMSHVIAVVKLQIYKTADSSVLWKREDVEKIAETFATKDECHERWNAAEVAVHDINLLRDELFSIARRGATLYGVMRSLIALRPEYEYSMDYFLELFDQAVGNAPPDEFFHYKEVSSTSPMDSSRDSPSAKTKSSNTMRSADAQEIQSQENGKQKDDNVTDGEEASFIQTILDAQDQESCQRVIEQIRGLRGTDAIGRELNVNDHVIRELQSDAELECEGEAPDHNAIETIPSDGVEYSSMDGGNISEILEKLTSNIYNHINMSLYEEDRLLFSTLLCVNINSEDDSNSPDNELSLLTQGNPGLNVQLSLTDFNCDSAVPEWLPVDVWEEILAVSVLQGGLSNLCVSVANDCEKWKTWYQSQNPEDEALPLKTNAADSNRGSATPDNRSDLHHLMIIRILRPDRFPLAMAKYVSRHLPIMTKTTLSLTEITDSMANHYHGILVLLPPSDEHSVSSVKMTESPAEKIRDIAQDLGISIESVRIQPYLPIPIERTIESAEKNNGWLLIEDLHLGTQQFCKEFVYHLNKTVKSRETLEDEKQRESKFCVWITSEPGHNLPSNLLHQLYKLTWDHVTDQLMTSKSAGQGRGQSQGQGEDVNREDAENQSQAEGGNPTQEDGGSQSKAPVDSQSEVAVDSQSEAAVDSQSEVLEYRNIRSVFSNVMIKSLQSISVPDEDSTQEMVRYIFGLCIIHAVLLSRQILGTRGLARWSALGVHHLHEGVAIIGQCLKGGELSLEVLCRKLYKMVYGSCLSHNSDCRYVETLVCDVMTNINQSESCVTMGTVEIPMPDTENISEVAQWFEDKMENKEFSTLDVLSLSQGVEKQWNQTGGLEFIHKLERLSETNRMDSGDIAKDVFARLNMYSLRSSLDLCSENLPPLLELGDGSKMVNTARMTFPYHCPSVLSFSTASSSLMPESIGFTLLQECLWLNTLLCHVRQTIYELRQCLLSGPDSIPRHLATVAMAMQKEHVPVSWIHISKQPGVHTLLSWIQDTRRCYDQMYSWVKYGLVPSDGHTSIPHGQLKSLWLGGLVNPQAVFTALKQEKAVISDCLATDIILHCEVVDSKVDRQSPGAEDANIVVDDLYVQGAVWDETDKCLKPCLSSDMNLLPLLSISAQKVNESESDQEEKGNELEPGPEEKVTESEPDHEEKGIESEPDHEEKGIESEPDHKEKGIESEPDHEDKVKESEPDPEQDVDAPSITYSCPVFMNQSRQVSVLYLSLPCHADDSSLIHSGTALILDPGIPEGAMRHSRTLRHIKQTQLTFTPRLVDYETEALEQDSQGDAASAHGESTLTASKQFSSQPSQLSYKEFTPKASPLPPALKLTRDEKLGDKKADDDRETDADAEKDTARTDVTVRTDQTESELNGIDSEQSTARDAAKGSIDNQDDSPRKSSSSRSSSSSKDSHKSSDVSKTEDKRPSRISERGETNLTASDVHGHESPTERNATPDSHKSSSRSSSPSNKSDKSTEKESDSDSETNSPSNSPRKDSQKGSPSGSPQRTPKGSPKTTPKGSPETTPKGSPKTTPKGSPKTTPKGSPKTTPQGSPEATPKGSPKTTPKGSPKTTPKGSPKTTPKGSPETTPKGSPETTPKGSPKTTPKGSPKTTPKGSPKTTPKGSPKTTPKGSPKTTPKGSPKTTPKGSPKTTPRGSPTGSASNVASPRGHKE